METGKKAGGGGKAGLEGGKGGGGGERGRGGGGGGKQVLIGDTSAFRYRMRMAS